LDSATARPRERTSGPDTAPVEPGPSAPSRLEQIYFEAARLFVQNGFAGTSMSDIAKAVNITKAGLYHFVSGKEELLYTIMSFGLDQLEEEVVRPALAVKDARERLVLIVRNHARNVLRGETDRGNPITIVVDEASGLTGENRRRVDARKRAYFELIRDTLGQLKKQKRLADVDTTVAAFSIIGTILWLARWHRPDGKLSLDEIAEQVVRLTLGGVLKPSA
jgi:AcrR family transcriptional regulator